MLLESSLGDIVVVYERGAVVDWLGNGSSVL